jgi:hypothetical protein
MVYRCGLSVLMLIHLYSTLFLIALSLNTIFGLLLHFLPAQDATTKYHRRDVLNSSNLFSTVMEAGSSRSGHCQSIWFLASALNGCLLSVSSHGGESKWALWCLYLKGH